MHQTSSVTAKKTPVSLVRAGVMIVLFVGINLIDWSPVVDVLGVPVEWTLFLVNLLLVVCGVLLYGGYLRAEWRRLRARLRGRGWRFFWGLIGLTFVAYVLNVVTFAISERLFGEDGVPINQEMVGGLVDLMPAFMSFLMIAVFAPLLEELTFRESIIGVAPNSKVWLIAVLSVVSALVFAFMHVVELHEFWRYLPIAVLLTFFYLRHGRNVWAPIAFHGLYNFTGYLLLLATM